MSVKQVYIVYSASDDAASFFVDRLYNSKKKAIKAINVEIGLKQNIPQYEEVKNPFTGVTYYWTSRVLF